MGDGDGEGLVAAVGLRLRKALGSAVAADVVVDVVEVDEVDELQIGTTARFRTALGESLPALVTVSWQFSWERLHLRVGIPLTRGAPALFALPQAFRLYWVLGPLGGPSAQAAPPVGIEEADLTP